MTKGRKVSGGKYHKLRKKKKHSLAGIGRKVKVRETKQKLIRGMGGNKRKVLLSSDFVNVINNGKAQKVRIKNVLETPANRFLARQNILTKGALIETELGKARITNRPSQEGSVHAELLNIE